MIGEFRRDINCVKFAGCGKKRILRVRDSERLKGAYRKLFSTFDPDLFVRGNPARLHMARLFSPEKHSRSDFLRGWNIRRVRARKSDALF
jgi:hypothetical protein